MCGIVGYVQFQGAADPGLPRFVQAARDRLAHRGPDDAGLYVSPDGLCVLGSRRLSILDLSGAANQPMSNEDATLWIVFNGEIYNYIKLRKELVDNGHQFRSSSDTEVILHLFEEHGPALVHYLDGIFSFVIYDAKRSRLFGARDRLGVKPLYYAHSSKRFAFASEPKALLAFPDVSREPNMEELPSYLTFNCVPGPRTLFRDIEKLEPGMLFEVTAESHFRKRRFWLPGERIDGERAGCIDHPNALEAPLREAVAKRMVSDVPFGATLSGGIDSSLVVALMTDVLGAPVRTFTIGYEGDEINTNTDLSYARLVARQFSTNHHEVIISNDEFLAVLDEDLPALTDDPIGTPSETALVHLAKYSKRNGVTVLQVGEGADEAFCGYTSVYQLWRFYERMAILRHLVPRRFARVLARTFAPLFERVKINPSRIGSKDGTVREHLHRYSSGEHLYWGYGVLFCLQEQESLFSRGRLPPFSDPYDRLRSRIADVSDFHQRSYLDQMAIIDLLLELPERLLMRLDKATMLYGVEARVPFLDPSVLKAAFQVPAKLRALGQKGFLKAYARYRLPSDILARPKAGFPVARRVFLAPTVLSRIREGILSKRFLDFTGFDRNRLGEFLGACEGGRSGCFSQVWSLYILALWFEHWIMGKR